MSDEQATEATEAQVEPVAIEMRKECKELVDQEQSNNGIRGRVVQQLAQKEIDRRTELLAKALSKREEKAKELAKLKPDMRGYAENGDEKMAYYSKDKQKQLESVRKELSKIDKAINRAMSDADYEGIKKFAE